MSVQAHHIALARTLPPKLLSFLARYPPGTAAAGASTSSPSTFVPDTTSSALPQRAPQPGYERPFDVTRHSITGAYHGPTISLRRQADLSKLAREHGVQELLPFTMKSFEARKQRREEHDLRVKGTGVGQRVKGHWWERTLRTRLEVRRQAMREMPELIRTWKQVGQAATLMWLLTDQFTAGSRSRMEEVPEIKFRSALNMYKMYLGGTSGGTIKRVWCWTLVGWIDSFWSSAG